MYLDSAIMVKLLVRENDSEWFNPHLVGHELWNSELALTEMCSAILIKERAGHLSVAERKLALARLESMPEDKLLHLQALNSSVVERAAGLLKTRHPHVALRSLDALHQATAMIPLRGPLRTTDAKLRAAAVRVGATYFPEEISETLKN